MVNPAPIQSRISRTPYPPIGVGTLSQGAQNSAPSPLSTPEKASIPKLKYEALEIKEVRGPFERKVLMHYCYFGPLWKQGIYSLQLLLGAPLESKVAYLYITGAVAPLWKQGTQHITVAKRAPRQVPRLPSLKRTTGYSPDNDLILQYETDWTQPTSSDMRTFSLDVRMQAL